MSTFHDISHVSELEMVRLVITENEGVFLWRVSPSLGVFGAHGHVQIPTVHQIPYVSGLEMSL